MNPVTVKSLAPHFLTLEVRRCILPGIRAKGSDLRHVPLSLAPGEAGLGQGFWHAGTRSTICPIEALCAVCRAESKSRASTLWRTY